MAIAEGDWSRLPIRRLDHRYRAETDADAVARYFFNAALCEALYPSLQGIEVALRNSLNDVISEPYGAGWLSPSSIYLTKWDQTKVLEAQKRLDKEKEDWEKPDVVAGMSFGFWVGLLSKNYDASTRAHSASWWPNLLKPAFPHTPKRLRQRSVIEGRLTKMRRLRNRVFHHEPIWHYADLSDQHTEIVETISWVCPELSKTVSLFDRFPAIHSAGMDPYLQKIRAVLEAKE